MAVYAKTIQEIIDDVLAECRCKIGSTAEYHPMALTKLNEIFQTLPLYNNRGWKWLNNTQTISAVSGTQGYDLNPDVGAIIEVYYTSEGLDYLLDEVSRREARLRYPDDSDTGLPRLYTFGTPSVQAPQTSPDYQQIDLFPVPSGSLTINIGYERVIETYTSAGDLAEVPRVPAYMIPIVSKFLESEMLKHLKRGKGEWEPPRIEALGLINLAKGKDFGRNRASLSIRPNSLVLQYKNRRANR